MPSGERMVFALDNLAIFERHGATVERDGMEHRCGCIVRLPNGWRLSVQWGPGYYSTNRDLRIGMPAADVPPATDAEIAVLDSGGGLVEWVSDGDTVQGWCSMERVLHVLDLLAKDELVQEVPQPPKVLAVDNWQRFDAESEDGVS